MTFIRSVRLTENFTENRCLLTIENQSFFIGNLVSLLLSRKNKRDSIGFDRLGLSIFSLETLYVDIQTILHILYQTEHIPVFFMDCRQARNNSNKIRSVFSEIKHQVELEKKI